MRLAQQRARKARFYSRGKAFYEKGDYVKARLEFRSAVQVAPRFAEGYYMLGMVEFQEKNWRNAFGCFSEAVRLDPGNLPADVKLGRIFLIAGEPDRAAEKADFVLRAEPNNEDGLFLKTAAYLAKQDPDMALACLEGLKTRTAHNPDFWLMTASAYVQKKDFQKAKEALLDGIAANPQSVLIHLALADIWLKMNRPDDAVPVLRTVIRLAPEAAGYRVNLAGLLWDRGRTPEATDVLNGIVAGLKGDERWIAVALFYVQKGKIDAAEEALKKGRKNNKKSFALRFALADFYLGASRSDDAIGLLKECVSLSKDQANSDVLRAKNSLARIHLARHETEEAEKYLDEILRDNPKNNDARFQKGVLQLERGEGSEAVAQFRAVLNENPGSVPAMLRLAEAYIVSGQANLAEDCLQSALKANPASIEVQRAIGRFYAARREFSRAEEYLGKLREAHPDDMGVIAELAGAFLVAGDVKRAEEGYREIERKAPQSPLGFEKMGRLRLAQGKVDQAAPELRSALRLAPRSEELVALVADALAKQGKYHEAIMVCDERLKEDPKDAPSWAFKAFLFEGLKDFPKAEDALRQAIALRPLWPAPHINLARLCFALGKPEGARKDLEDALKINPGNPMLALFLSYALYRSGEPRSAMEGCENLLKQYPNFWMAANGLAFMLADQSASKANLDKALILAQKAQKLRPNEASVMDTLGWVYYKKGDASQAMQWIGKARAASPADPTMSYHMGMALLSAGKKQEAKQFLSKALAGGEDFTGAREAREMMKGL